MKQIRHFLCFLCLQGKLKKCWNKVRTTCARMLYQIYSIVRILLIKYSIFYSRRQLRFAITIYHVWIEIRFFIPFMILYWLYFPLILIFVVSFMCRTNDVWICNNGAAKVTLNFTESGCWSKKFIIRRFLLRMKREEWLCEKWRMNRKKTKDLLRRA